MGTTERPRKHRLKGPMRGLDRRYQACPIFAPSGAPPALALCLPSRTLSMFVVEKETLHRAGQGGENFCAALQGLKMASGLSSDLTHLHAHVVLSQEAKQRRKAELTELTQQIADAEVK